MIRRKQGDWATEQQQRQQPLLSEITNEATSNSNSLSHSINHNACPPPTTTSPCPIPQETFSEPPPTWRSQVSELTTRTRKRDLILCQSIFLITSLVTAIMNCAITIFGMGIGVGLILGDTLRTNASSSASSSASRFPTHVTSSGDVDTMNSNVAATMEESTVVVVRPATSDCRAVIRRVPARPSSSSASASSGFGMHSNPTLPAQ